MTTTSTPAATAGYRATFGKVTRILAMATGTLVVIQFVLAGYGTFGHFQGERDFRPHEILGNVIGGVTLLVLIAALIARTSGRRIVSAVVLFVLAGPIQPILADAGKDHAWIGGLHALAGILILGACFDLSRKITEKG